MCINAIMEEPLVEKTLHTLLILFDRCEHGDHESIYSESPTLDLTFGLTICYISFNGDYSLQWKGLTLVSHDFQIKNK